MALLHVLGADTSMLQIVFVEPTGYQVLTSRAQGARHHGGRGPWQAWEWQTLPAYAKRFYIKTDAISTTQGLREHYRLPPLISHICPRSRAITTFCHL